MKEITPAVPEKIIAVTCDCCKKRYEDVMEIQEFLSHSDTAGYGNNVFGDMNQWSIDLCQYCTKELLGKYITINKAY